MSTIIKFDLKELKELSNDKNSCVVEKKVTQNLALQPSCLGNLKESIKNLLNYKIGKFDKEFKGIVLSYKNLRILQNVGSIRNDSADVHFQVEADYFIFRPHIGATLKGVVNKKSPTHLGIIVHRVFNVVIPRPTEEPGNKWIGASIVEGQQVVFRIVVLDLYGALPYIRGELDERYLKLGDGDEELEEPFTTSQLVNVSHVNFDKTKPSSQRQTGDGLPNASKLNTSPEAPVCKNHHLKSKNVESKMSVTDKSKSKQHSKDLMGDIKQADVNITPSKKHKKR